MVKWITNIQYTHYPELHGNTHQYPEIPESKEITRKYPIVYFNTTTQPKPDLLPGISSYNRPDPILKNPTRWALQPAHIGIFNSFLQLLRWIIPARQQLFWDYRRRLFLNMEASSFDNFEEFRIKNGHSDNNSSGDWENIRRKKRNCG